MPLPGNKAHVEKVLAALEALLEGKATADVMSYSIAGRSLSKFSISELLLWHDKYKAELVQIERAEKLAQGLGHTGTIQVRF
jgi:hypothetical protein